MALIVEGKRRQAEAAHAERAWLAWHIATLSRAKVIPRLRDLLPKKRSVERPRSMSADEMLSIAKLWSAAAGPEKKGR